MVQRIHNIVRTGARLLVAISSGLALLVAIILAATQVGFVRNWGLEYGLEALNAELEGKIEVGSVSGNILTGLSLHDVKLHAANTTVIEAPLVELQYQLRPFFNDKIIGARVQIYRPVIRLIRNARDSTWNFEHIARKKAVSPATTSPFPYTINLAELEIRDGDIGLSDLTSPDRFDTVARSVDYGYLKIDNLNLSARAEIEPARQLLLIQNLSFAMPRHEFRLVELSGNFRNDTTGVNVKDLRIETGRSLLDLSAHLDSVNLMATNDTATWRGSPLHVEMTAPHLSTLELKRFIPALGFLGGTPGITLAADGTIGNLEIKRLNLGLHPSVMNVTGRLRNLDRPDSLWLDLKIKDSHVADRDVLSYIPGIKLPDLRYLGDVEIRSGEFRGRADNFHLSVDATTAVGEARGAGRLDLRGNVMRYAVDMAVAHGNLGPVIADATYESDFTGRVVAEGSGTTLKELNTRILLKSESSRVMQRGYRRMVVAGTLRDGGFFQVDTIATLFGGDPRTANGVATLASSPKDIDAYLKSPAEQTLRSRGATLSESDRSLLSSGSSIGASGWLDLRNASDPKYHLQLRGNHFSLADILPDGSESRFSFTAAVDGSGFDPETILGTADVKMTEAELPSGEKLEPINAKVSLSREGTGSNRSLVVESDIADLTLSGEWNYSTIVPRIMTAVQGVTDYLSRKIKHRDDFLLMGGSPYNGSVNAQYSLTVKDLSPLMIFLNGTQLSAHGKLEGSISGTSQILNVEAKGLMQDVRYAKGETHLELYRSAINITMNGIAPGYLDETAVIDISVATDSLARYNDIVFNSPNITLNLEDGAFHIHGGTAVNSNIAVAVDGIVDTRDPSGYRVAFDTLIVTLPNDLRWRNQGKVVALIGENDVRIDSFAMRRNTNEVIGLQGRIIDGNRLDMMKVSITEGSLRDFADFMKGSDAYESVREVGGKLRQTELLLNGTLEEPTIEGTIAVDSARYGGVLLGGILIDFNYAAKNLAGRIRITDARLKSGDTSRLGGLITITSLPIDLAFASRKERILTTEKIDIRAITDSLPLAFLQPFVPSVKIYGGALTTNVNIGGYYPDVGYNGKGTIANGKLLVESTNILYYADGDLSFTEKRLTIERITLRNDPNDLPGGLAQVTGHIDLEGFSPKKFRFVAETEKLLVLSEATQAVNTGIFGDLIVATSGQLLTFEGTSFTAPVLTGAVDIIRMNLRVEQTDVAATRINAVNYIDYEEWIRQNSDTAKFGPPPPDFDEEPLPHDSTKSDTTTKPRRGSLEAQSQSLEERIASTRGVIRTGTETPFYDLMTIRDLKVKMRGLNFLTIDFSPFQQLRAELTTKDAGLTINKGPRQDLDLVGTVVVEPTSRFVFFKTFNASGSLEFDGKMENAKMAVRADYTNRFYGSSSSSIGNEFTVTVNLTGRVNQPELDLTYVTDKGPTSTDRETRQRNAISLLLLGQLADQLTGSLSNQVTTFAGTFGESSLSSVASRALTDILATNLDFIRSVDVDLGGAEDIGQARLNFVSQFGNVIVRAGGRISNPTADGTITVDLPLNVVTNLKQLRNLVLQLEREAQTQQSTSGASEGTETYRLRLQYRLLW